MVQDLIRKLEQHFAVRLETLAGIEENVHFRLPPELADQAVRSAVNRRGWSSARGVMGIPLRQQLRVGAYVLKQRLLGRDRYPWC